MGRGDWEYGAFPPKQDGSYIQVLGGVGPLEISEDGQTIKNLVTDDTYDLTAIGSGGGGSSYSDEDAQDAVGTTFDSSLSYSDSGPSMGIATGGVGTDQLADDSITTAKVVADAVTQALIAGEAVGSTELVTEDVQDIAGGMVGENLTYDDPNDVINATDTHVAVSDDGVEVLADPDDIDLGPLLSAADDGDNSVTVSVDSSLVRETFAPSGQVSSGNAATLRTIEVADGETYEIYSAGLLLADGQPAPTDLDLVIATMDNDGSATHQTTVVDGDGSKQNDLSGSPLASYENTSGDTQTVAVMVDNGQFNDGSGSTQEISAHFEEEVTT